MAPQTDIVTKASEFIAELFRMHPKEHLLYHTLDHTKSVAETARKIGTAMKLGEEGIEVVTLAGWFHDTGYTELYRGHEEVSVLIAKEFLEKENYPQEKIELITGCIRATKIPQQPKNLLEEVVADADLAGLGRKSFFEQSRLLHTEWEKEFEKEYSEKEWTEQNINLLSGHKYFTRFAEKSFGERQAENLHTLYKKLRKINSFQRKESQDETGLGLPHNYSDNDNIPETSTQMLFKLVSNTLMIENFSADHKALIMILANAILIFVNLTVLGMGIHGSLISWSREIPSILLLLVSIFTIIFSVLSMRQRINVGEEENLKIRTPLFGIFYAKSYDNFDRRMKENTDENDLSLYGAMSREYYDQRIMVARKYRFLYLSYTTFMYGFCLFILTFFLFLVVHF